MTTPFYADEWVKLYHGDCLDVLASLDDKTVDTVLTDPPYSSGGRRENARSLRVSMTRGVDDDDWIRGDAMGTQTFMWFMRTCGLEWRRILRPGGHVLSFIDWRMAYNLLTALESADLRQHPIVVWDKATLGMGAFFRNQHEFIVHLSAGTPTEALRRDIPNVIRVPKVRDVEHPTEKPDELLRILLSVVSPAGGVVLDPFAGSGSTLFAAKGSGRRAIGVEADERYAEIAARRLSQDVLDFEESAPT